MSVIFDATTEAAKRTTAIVAGSSAYTCCFYVKFTATPGVLPDYQTAFLTVNGTGTYTQYAGLFRFDDTKLYLRVANGGAPSTSTGFTMVEDVWFRVAYVRSGTANRFYVQAPSTALTLINTVTLNMAATSLTEIWIGDDTLSSSGMEIAYFREWNSALSLTQLDIEFSASVAFKDTLLVTDCPLQADLDDISGNGNDLAAVGSPTFAASIPALLANGGPTTAEDMGTLPFSDAIDLDVDGLQYEAWYKYTSGSESVIGFWAYGDNLTPLVVVTNVFSDTFGPNLSIVSSKTNRPVQVPNPTPGTVFYFQISPNFAATSDLIVSALAFNDVTAPIGSIAVNDDTENFPLALLSGVDGDDYHPLRFVNNYVMGEAGDVLATGEACTSDNENNIVVVYDNQYVQVTTVPLSVSSNAGTIRTCQGTQRWWVGYESSGRKARYVETDGTLGTAHALTGVAQVECLAASNDETILYHCGTTVSNRAISRWDLVNDVALTILIAEVAGYFTSDILVLSDDTIIYNLVDATGTPDVQVRHVDTTGTILHTYNFGSSFVFPVNTPPRLAYAIDDPNSFWIWTHPILGTDDGLSRFQEVDVATGTILKEIDSAEYEVGAYQPDASDPPLARFGNSFSCPFWITRVAVPFVDDVGTLIVTKLTVPTDVVTEFEVNVTGPDGLDDDLTMQDGDTTTYTDVPAGTYSVIETLIPDPYRVSYDVSNGDPNTAIVLETGQEITVTIVNTAGGGGTFTIPTIPTGPSGPGPFPPEPFPPTPPIPEGTPQPWDDYPTPSTGEIVPVKIPNPFFVTGGVVDS